MLARDWLNTYYLEDTGLFRVSLGGQVGTLSIPPPMFHPEPFHAASVCIPSRNGASFAVALNCGIGSSSLNADVKEFSKLHNVLGANSSIVGLKYKSCTRRARCFGASRSPSTNAR